MKSERSYFRRYATTVKKELERYREENDEEDLTSIQGEKVTALVEAERTLRRRIEEEGLTEAVYRNFLVYIATQKRSILAASPYFRVREALFNSVITDAIRDEDIQTLAQQDFNWQFIAVAEKAGIPGWEALREDVERVRALREELIVANLPLAISRGQIFYGRVPKSHLSFMDFMQIAADGLMAAVDKYVLPYSSSFRSVIVGRITGNFIREYSATPMHFYPSDRRKLYRANAERSKVEEGDWEALADAVNEKLEGMSVTPSEVEALLSAASLLSIDSLPPTIGDDGEPEPLINTIAADDSWRPDVQVEEALARQSVSEAIRSLSVFEQKLLALKGIAL